MSAIASYLAHSIAPHFARSDLVGALQSLTRHSTARDLLEALDSSDDETVALAARSLGLVGEFRHTEPLAALLRHPSPSVVEVAEEALWRVWMRAPDAYAQDLLSSAEAERRAGHTASCIEHLEALTLIAPTFAEGFHQLAMTLDGVGRSADAADAYRRALELNPWHFAAAASLGHWFVQSGRLAEALAPYRRAIAIHPGLSEIRELLPRLEAALART